MNTKTLVQQALQALKNQAVTENQNLWVQNIIDRSDNVTAMTIDFTDVSITVKDKNSGDVATLVVDGEWDVILTKSDGAVVRYNVDIHLKLDPIFDGGLILFSSY